MFSYHVYRMAHHPRQRAQSPAGVTACTARSPDADAGDLVNALPADRRELWTNSSCRKTHVKRYRTRSEHHNPSVSRDHTYPSPGTSLSLRPRAWSWLEKLTNSSPSSPGGRFLRSLAKARRAALSSLFLSNSHFLLLLMGFPDCFLDMVVVMFYTWYCCWWCHKSILYTPKCNLKLQITVHFVVITSMIV